MKKYYLVLISVLLVFLFGCNKNGEIDMSNQLETSFSEIDSNKDGDMMFGEDVLFEEGIYDNKDWDNMSFTVEDDCVKDKETAIEIAKSITAGFQKEGLFPGYVPQSVFFDTEDNIWIVCLYANEDGYLGSDFCIAIKKDNAEVVKMWVGE